VIGLVVHRAAKRPEGFEQAGLCVRGQVFRADLTERGDGLADLLNDVLLERPGRVRVQVALEVVGDQFDDLAAAEHTHGGHRSLPSLGRSCSAMAALGTVSSMVLRKVAALQDRLDAQLHDGSGTVVRLQRRPKGTAPAVQQDALIAGGKFEQVADLVGAETLDVAHRDDQALPCG
jgi:hypothetical protein